MQTDRRGCVLLGLLLGQIALGGACEREEGSSPQGPGADEVARRIPDFDPRAPAPKAPPAAPQPEQEPPAPQPASAEPWPREQAGWELLACSDERLLRFLFDPGERVFKVGKSVRLPGITDMVRVAGFLYATDGKRVFRLDSQLRVLGQTGFGEVVRLATDGRGLYVLADEALVSLGPELQPLSRAELVCENPKNGHDVVFHDRTAHVLDDLYQPVCIMRVDVADPRALNTLETIRFGGVHMRLEHQWVDARARQWVVVARTGHRNGTFQHAHVYSSRGGRQQRFEQALYSEARSRRSRKLTKKGRRVVAVLAGEPIRVILEDRDGSHHLARLRSGRKKLRFVEEKRLSRGGAATRITYQTAGKCLFADRGCARVEVFGLEKGIPLVLEQDLESALPEGHCIRAVLAAGPAGAGCMRSGTGS